MFREYCDTDTETHHVTTIERPMHVPSSHDISLLRNDNGLSLFKQWLFSQWANRSHQKPTRSKRSNQQCPVTEYWSNVLSVSERMSVAGMHNNSDIYIFRWRNIRSRSNSIRFALILFETKRNELVTHQTLSLASQWCNIAWMNLAHSVLCCCLTLQYCMVVDMEQQQIINLLSQSSAAAPSISRLNFTHSNIELPAASMILKGHSRSFEEASK